VGTAVSFPTATALSHAGNTVVAVIGARTGAQLLLEDELRAVCAEVHACTDDGSSGRHGLVTDVLAELLAERSIDRVLAAGPVAMMRAVAEATRPHGVPTIASLNPIMVDGTGMCGGCRVSIGGVNRFACLDGPDFDAHLVDFELLDLRNRAYADWEGQRAGAPHPCAGLGADATDETSA
jgi:NAD(P)H-flavin reductase